MLVYEPAELPAADPPPTARTCFRLDLNDPQKSTEVRLSELRKGDLFRLIGNHPDDTEDGLTTYIAESDGKEEPPPTCGSVMSRPVFRMIDGRRYTLREAPSDIAPGKLPPPSRMVTPMAWEAFRDRKLLWAVNTFLHLFGVAIVMDCDANDRIIRVYPARTAFRGFPDSVNEEGFTALHQWLLGEMTKIAEESQT